MKVSHSQIQRYHQCPHNYKLHYLRKLRPDWTTSALIFGDALDAAFNSINLKNGEDPQKIFLEKWTNGFINKIPTYFPTCTKLLYANKDYDPSLLTEEDYREVETRIASGELKEFKYDELLKKKSDNSWDNLSDDEKKTFNFYNWLCMKQKGKLIIEGYLEEIAPNILKVHAVQIPIAGDNGHGDEITGYVDLIADVKVGDNVFTTLLDHKSSSIPYDWDAPRKSPQLALYKHMEGEKYNITHVGFIVMKKKIGQDKIKVCKKCGHNGSKSRAKTCDKTTESEGRCHGEWDEKSTPKAEFQFLVCEMPEQFEHLVLDSIDETVDAIKKEVFPKNLSSCHDWYGGDCQYLKYCMSGGKNTKGLIDGEEK